MELQSGLSVSHEAIYTAIYALPRGELRRELISCLRQDKPMRGRKPKGSERRGKLVNMTNIKERPEEIEGRLVPGHWEGDLILGAGGASAIGTLVERSTRFVVLVRMPTRKADPASPYDFARENTAGLLAKASGQITSMSPVWICRATAWLPVFWPFTNFVGP